MSIEVREAPKCINCGYPLTILPGQTQVRCRACSCCMEIASFTQEERRLAEKIEQAAMSMQSAAERLGTAQEASFAELKERLDALQAEQEAALAHRMQKLYERAEEAQHRGNYRKALGYYEELLQINRQEEAEVHWRVLLCRYGVEYVYEQDSERYLPTISNMDEGCVLEDPDLHRAVALARTQEMSDYYRSQAEELERIRRAFCDIRAEQTPYDVFISVKQGDGTGRPTEDSLVALDMYTELEKRGLRVFNSRKSLEGCAGLDYEPYIMAALSSARVMLVMGSSAEYLTSPWVRNEWRRFRHLQEQEGNGRRRLIPYLIGMPASQLPPEIGGKQAISTQSLAPMQQLWRVLDEVFGDAPAAAAKLRQRSFLCPFCGAEMTADGPVGRCGACGNHAAPPEGQPEWLRHLQDAIALREQRAFQASADRFAAIRIFNPTSHHALFGELLAQLQVAFVPVGRDAAQGLKPCLCTAPGQEAVAQLDAVTRQITLHAGLQPQEKECCLNVLQRLKETAESYLRQADAPAWDVLLCCAPEDHPRAEAIRAELEGWGYRAFLANPGLRGNQLREQEIRAMHAAFTARVLLPVAAAAERFYEPGIANEAMRFTAPEGEIIPVVFSADVEIPAEFNPVNALIWDGEDAAEALCSDLMAQIPQVTACSHRGQLLDTWLPGSAGRGRRCVRCGHVQPGAGVLSDDAARLVQRCFESYEKRDFSPVISGMKAASDLVRQQAAGMDEAGRAALRRQMLLMGFVSFSAMLGLRIFRTGSGWQGVVGAYPLTVTQELHRRYAMLKDHLGDVLGDLLHPAYQTACSLAERSASAAHAEVGLTLRTPSDGGSERAFAFAEQLTASLRERGLLVSSCTDRGSGTCWGLHEEEQYAAATQSQLLLALVDSPEDVTSPEMRKQTGRVPEGKAVQYLALTSEAAQGLERVRVVANCDEANAAMLAETLRQRFARHYMRQVVTLGPAYQQHLEELRTCCERGMALTAGSELREFQCVAGMLYRYPGSPFREEERGVALLQEAARYGNAKAIDMCRSHGLRY